MRRAFFVTRVGCRERSDWARAGGESGLARSDPARSLAPATARRSAMCLTVAFCETGCSTRSDVGQGR
jgi:hypothetical protein